MTPRNIRSVNVEIDGWIHPVWLEWNPPYLLATQIQRRREAQQLVLDDANVKRRVAQGAKKIIIRCVTVSTTLRACLT